MKNRGRALVLAALLCVPGLAFAGGGGGIEYITNIGPDVLALPGLPRYFLDSPTTGTVIGASGFGYGITRGGWKIGGFGTFFAAGPFDFEVPYASMVYHGATGAFGGVLSGGFGRVGPFALSLELRLGAGGFVVSGTSTWDGDPMPSLGGSFAAFGSLDAELGLVVVPAMMLSVYAGVSGFVSLPYLVIPAAAPTMGVRITWGRF